MNHQTRTLIEDAKDKITDEGVFSLDQINLLNDMIEVLAKAIEKEALYSGSPFEIK